MRNLKGLRMVVTVGVLLSCLLLLSWPKAGSVEAVTCEEAWNNYLNADATYEIARQSYFYGIPATCESECAGETDPTLHQQCVDNCQTTRYTNLGQASISLFGLALDTCTPYQPDECAQARAIADNCLAQYNWINYSDPEEAMAVATQYMACRQASKVDACQ